MLTPRLSLSLENIIYTGDHMDLSKVYYGKQMNYTPEYRAFKNSVVVKTSRKLVHKLFNQGHNTFMSSIYVRLVVESMDVKTAGDRCSPLLNRLSPPIPNSWRVVVSMEDYWMNSIDPKSDRFEDRTESKNHITRQQLLKQFTTFGLRVRQMPDMLPEYDWEKHDNNHKHYSLTISLQSLYFYCKIICVFW